MRLPKVPPRRADWGARLSAYLAETSRRPFEWGAHDCVLFAAGAVDALTGVDPAASQRGKYRTAKGALGVMRRAGAATPGDLAALVLPEIPPAHADTGDLVEVAPDEGDMPALGIFQGEGAYAPGPEGWGIVPPGRILRAFKV